jgi:hypothetical protein
MKVVKVANGGGSLVVDFKMRGGRGLEIIIQRVIPCVRFATEWMMENIPASEPNRRNVQSSF